MIISVEEFKEFVTTTKDDTVLEGMLQALEILVRKYTNNNFQNRHVRFTGMIEEGVIYGIIPNGLKVGDTIQISESGINAGLYTIKSIDDEQIKVNEEVYDESHVLVTKIVYPLDVKHGVVDMLKWKLGSGDKVGIQSETISRHSVTYFNMDGSNSNMGYPISLLGFLKPYRKPWT